MYDTWIQMTRFLKSGEFDPTPVITHRFPMSKWTLRSPRSNPERRARSFSKSHNGEQQVALNRKFDDELKAGIEQLKKDKVYKRLNYLDSPQSARVRMEGRGEVLILSSNNYLGLCAEPEVVQAGLDGLDKFGAGTGAFASSAERSRSSRARESNRFTRRHGSIAFIRILLERQRRTDSDDRRSGDFVVTTP
jgi:hypothetical protein